MKINTNIKITYNSCINRRDELDGIKETKERLERDTMGNMIWFDINTVNDNNKKKTQTGIVVIWTKDGKTWNGRRLKNIIWHDNDKDENSNRDGMKSGTKGME